MIRRRAILSGLAATAAAPALAAGRAPRIPDFSGTWSNQTGTPLERPRAFRTLVAADAEARAYEAAERNQIHGIPGDDVGQDGTEWFAPNPPLMRIRGEARTSIIVDPPDGRLPYSPAGRAALGQQLRRMGAFEGPEVRPAAERCLIGFGDPAAAPMLPVPQTSATFVLVQTPQALLVRAESNNDLRIISLDPATPPPAAPRPWLGVSRGRWEGETLLVESTGFQPAEGLRSLPFMLYLSPDARVSERFTRISPGEILYAFTVEDPPVFTRAWRGELLFRATTEQVFEYACHEGNYSLTNILAGAREEERRRGTGR